MKGLMIIAILAASLQSAHAEETPTEYALRMAKTPLDRACIRWGGKDLFDCADMAKHCGEPGAYAKWAVANCGAAAFVACWPKGLRGDKLESCIDDYMDKHPPGPTTDRTPEAMQKFHDWCLKVSGDANCNKVGDEQH